MSHLYKTIAKLTIAATAAAMLSIVPATADDHGHGEGHGGHKYIKLGKEAKLAAENTDDSLVPSRQTRHDTVQGIQKSPFGMSIINELHGHPHGIGKGMEGSNGGHGGPTEAADVR